MAPPNPQLHQPSTVNKTMKIQFLAQSASQSLTASLLQDPPLLLVQTLQTPPIHKASRSKLLSCAHQTSTRAISNRNQPRIYPHRSSTTRKRMRRLIPSGRSSPIGCAVNRQQQNYFLGANKEDLKFEMRKCKPEDRTRKHELRYALAKLKQHAGARWSPNGTRNLCSRGWRSNGKANC